MFVASFSSHLAMLFVFAGLVPFTGVSMIYAPGFVNIADATSAENRPLSYAVAEAGCTIGGMAMPILFEWLRQEFTWRGALMISAGAFLQICPMALIMKPKATTKHLEALATPANTSAANAVATTTSASSRKSSVSKKGDGSDSPLFASVHGIVEDFGVTPKKKDKPLDIDIRKRIELLTKPLESEKEMKAKKKESVFVQRRRERQLSVETEVLLSSSFILYLT